ncbi:hypothetical protein D3C77_403700 [compost metagenome]
MRKSLSSLSIIAVLFGLVVISIYSQYQLRYGQSVYNFDIQTDDFYIRDIEFVVSPYSLFVTGHYLEVIGNDKTFDGISYGLSVGGTMIMSRSQAGNPFILPHTANGIEYVDISNLINNIKVRKHDSIKVEIQYEVNGNSKDIVGDIKLSDVAKRFTSTEMKKVIDLRLAPTN